LTEPAAGVPPSAAVEPRPLAQIPWAATHSEFVRAAGAIHSNGACCVFVIDRSIPREARAGYAALVIAYARADEPVLILDDGGAALLVREGGTAAAEIVAQRVLNQMRRLALQQTLRAGVVPLRGDCDASVLAARAAADGAAAGEIGIAA
jgi:hypothetical protein